MAKTGKVFTMQGIGSPVSAAGQGEQAGPQASLSCDRSSLVVGNLATKRSRVSRKLESLVSGSHKCSEERKNLFCYVCGKYVIKKHRQTFTVALQALFNSCYKLHIEVSEMTHAPKTICNSCRVLLQRSKTGEKRKVLSPVKWMNPGNRENCFFCATKIGQKPEQSCIIYGNVSSMIPATFLSEIKAVAISEGESSAAACMDVDEMDSEGQGEIDEFMDQDEDEESVDQSENEKRMDQRENEVLLNESEDDGEDRQSSSSSEAPGSEDSDDDFRGSKPSKLPQPFAQDELNDLIRNLGLPKDASEVLASTLKKKNLLAKGVKVSVYRKREEQFRQFFENQDSIVYCANVLGLMDALKPGIYKDKNWRLFIDSSKSSLKAVLLHNTNKYAPVPVGFSKVHKEEYNSMKLLLKKLNYNEHQWLLCGDLKILTILLGQQSGFTKYPCFLCMWDSRAQDLHYTNKVWEKRDSFEIGKGNIIHKPLVAPEKVLLPPLHIKLGLMKQFVKSLDKDGRCFGYIEKKFPKLSEVKLQGGIFNGPQIRTLMRDEGFIKKMKSAEKKAWTSFKDVCDNFLGNHKHPEYRKKVRDLVENYKNQKCLMNLKLHFLDRHVDDFPQNLGHYSEEQGERFHQDFKEMEERYQGHWDINMMADYCWSLKRDVPVDPTKKRKRAPLRRSFEDKRERYHKKKKHLE